MGKAELTKHQLEIITETVLKEYRKQDGKKKKEEKSRNLRNTELLLKNYIKLKELCDETIQESIPADYPEFSLESLTLESLSIYRKKTFLMMNHVDKMLVAYEWNCRKGSIEEQRRYKVLKIRYLSEDHLTVKEIVELHNIDQSTVYRDTKQAVKDMSILLFGIDAIDFQ
ncbi:helix-turn-helix domain-containing protein [Enterococcus massiliensis]|uniref:helix-turn-helix domain-containing protein n=1 Tax=Enterococcus massiliensis TaxID=1640685 RepID=UPI00065E77F9|nr:helix-turn-helix domain-containing protein [Enterococcus massiliensis]